MCIETLKRLPDNKGCTWFILFLSTFDILPGTSEYDCGPVTLAPISAPVPGLAKLFFISSSPPLREAMAE